MKLPMAPRWLSSFLEKDKVLRTSLEQRCLGHDGTCRACPLPEGVVETFNEVGLTAPFVNMMELIRVKNGVVSLPEVDKSVCV